MRAFTFSLIAVYRECKSKHGDDHSSSPSSPRVAAAVTKKEEDLPALGSEQHIDEPRNLAWLRPMKSVQARGGVDPRSMPACHKTNIARP